MKSIKGDSVDRDQPVSPLEESMLHGGVVHAEERVIFPCSKASDIIPVRSGEDRTAASWTSSLSGVGQLSK